MAENASKWRRVGAQKDTDYDSLGNQHQGTPQELAVDVHIAPAAPITLGKNSYDKTSKVLILDAA